MCHLLWRLWWKYLFCMSTHWYSLWNLFLPTTIAWRNMLCYLYQTSTWGFKFFPLYTELSKKIPANFNLAPVPACLAELPAETLFFCQSRKNSHDIFWTYLMFQKSDARVVCFRVCCAWGTLNPSSPFLRHEAVASTRSILFAQLQCTQHR